MTFVLDNSVTMRWLFEDGSVSDLAYADMILALMKDRTAVVPVTWGLEVANVIARAKANTQLTARMSGAFIEMLHGMNIEVDTDTFDYAVSDTLQLSRQYKLSSYDASYLELALRRGIPLATLDDGLRKAAKRAGVKRA